MDHNAMRENLFALYDGELSGEARREAEAHLTTCAECRQDYAQWQRTARVFFHPPSVETSEVFVHQVMGRLDSVGRPRRVVPWAGIRWGIPALGLVGLLLFMLGPAQRSVSLEALLLADGVERTPTQLVLASDMPSTEDLLGLVMEESP